MGKVPRVILVPLVIIIGIIALVMSQEPHSPCDSQKELFLESQAGYIFRATKGRDRAPQYRRFLAICREGASPGACYELFALVRKTLRDLRASPLNCAEQFRELPELQRALADTLEILVVMGWGNQPPEPGASKYSWLETSDLALFCQLRQSYIHFFGQEEFDSLRTRIQAVLPGEPLVIGKDGKCQNCIDQDKNPDTRRQMATEVLSSDDIWYRSVFSVRCDQYF